jgi:hypothetical protein
VYKRRAREWQDHQAWGGFMLETGGVIVKYSIVKHVSTLKFDLIKTTPFPPVDRKTFLRMVKNSFFRFPNETAWVLSF